MNRKLMLGLCLALSLLLAGSYSSAATQMLDSVVAIVEDDVIMSSELRERLELLKASNKLLPVLDLKCCFSHEALPTK